MTIKPSGDFVARTPQVCCRIRKIVFQEFPFSIEKSIARYIFGVDFYGKDDRRDGEEEEKARSEPHVGSTSRQ